MTSPDVPLTCRFETELEAYHLGQLEAPAADTVREHVAGCPACAASLEEVRRVFTLADRIEVIEPSLRFRREMDAFVAGLDRPARDAGAPVAEVPVFLLSYAAWKFRTSRGFRVLALSAMVHAAALLLLALLVLPRVEPREQEIRLVFEPPVDVAPDDEPAPLDGSSFAEDDSVLRDDDELGHATPRPPRAPEIPDDPLRDPRPVPLDGVLRRAYPTDRVAAWMSRRVDQARKSALVVNAYGDARSLDAIGRALLHLSATQGDDGSWAAGASAPGYRTGVTALAVLAFLGDGHSVHQGDHRRTVGRAAGWLVSCQDEVAGLIRTESRAGHDDDRPMYGHALATYALVELYGLDYRHFTASYRGRLRRTIRFAIAASEATANEDGGWRYLPGPGAGPSDASVTLWQLIALQAARDAGFTVSDAVVGRAAAFLKTLTDETGAQHYRVDRRESTGALNAGALAVARLLRTSDATRRVRAELVADARPTGDEDARDPLLWFLATLALRRDGDERAIAWARAIAPLLLTAQRPDGGWSEDVRYGSQGGRTYATAMGVLALEAVFRE